MSRDSDTKCVIGEMGDIRKYLHYTATARRIRIRNILLIKTGGKMSKGKMSRGKVSGRIM